MKSAILRPFYILLSLTAPITVLLTLGSLIGALWFRRIELLLIGFLLPYALPLALYRILNGIVPQQEGSSRIIKGVYHPWVAALAVQLIYGAFPFLEATLRLFPEAYSTWLRLWGSKVGRRVFFSPGFNLIDRGHLEVGDDVVFGLDVLISPHMARTRGNRRIVYLKKVRIGNGAFIGGRSYLGPGSEISGRHFMPGFATMSINMKDQCLLPEPRSLPVLSLDAPTATERREWIRDLRPAAQVQEA